MAIKKQTTKGNPAPIELLVVIVDRGKTDLVNQILSAYNVNSGVTTFAEGTAISKKVDFFGFGVIEREVVWAFVKVEDVDDILKQLTDELHLEKHHTGIAMTLPVKSASSNLLDLLSISYT